MATDIAFAGREWDNDLGLYYNRARWYDVNLGRFISEDPIGIASGDPNFYRYAGNDPVNFRDPSGLTQAGNPTDGLTVRINNLIDLQEAGFDASGIANLGGAQRVTLDTLAGQVEALNRQLDELRNQRASRAEQSAGLIARNRVLDNLRNRLANALQNAPLRQVALRPEDTRASLLAAAGRGAVIGAKIVGDAALDTTVSFATVGFVSDTDFIRFSDVERANAAFGTSSLLARGSLEFLAGVATGGASRLGGVGRAVTVLDVAGNASQLSQGIAGASQNGLSLSSGVQIVGSGLGLAGNFAGASRAIDNVPVGDVRRLNPGICFVAGTPVLVYQTDELVPPAKAAEETSQIESTSEWMMAGAAIVVGIVGWQIASPKKNDKKKDTEEYVEAYFASALA